MDGMEELGGEAEGCEPLRCLPVGEPDAFQVASEEWNTAPSAESGCVPAVPPMPRPAAG
jgi:hypothetical protein